MQDINHTGAKGQNRSIAQNTTKHQCHTHPTIPRRCHVSKSDSNHKTRLTHLRTLSPLLGEDAEIKLTSGWHDDTWVIARQDKQDQTRTIWSEWQHTTPMIRQTVPMMVVFPEWGIHHAGDGQTVIVSMVMCHLWHHNSFWRFICRAYQCAFKRERQIPK